jgi:hypothetical protein
VLRNARGPEQACVLCRFCGTVSRHQPRNTSGSYDEISIFGRGEGSDTQEKMKSGKARVLKLRCMEWVMPSSEAQM